MKADLIPSKLARRNKEVDIRNRIVCNDLSSGMCILLLLRAFDLSSKIQFVFYLVGERIKSIP